MPFISKKKKVWLPIYIWLLENLGQQGVKWTAKKDHYYFRDQQDFVQFQLRWL